MISRSDWKVAESIRQRVIAEGGYMFHERKEDGTVSCFTPSRLL